MEQVATVIISNYYSEYKLSPIYHWVIITGPIPYIRFWKGMYFIVITIETCFGDVLYEAGRGYVKLPKFTH